MFNFRAVAQPGSAPRSGRGGRWFESSLPDIQTECSLLLQLSIFIFYVGVAGSLPVCLGQAGNPFIKYFIWSTAFILH